MTSRIDKGVAERLFAFSDEMDTSVSDLIAQLVYRAVDAGEFDLEPTGQQRIDVEAKAS